MIEKLASNRENYASNTSFFGSAREAMTAWLDREARDQGGSARIVLPAFIGHSEREGSGVFDPVRSTNMLPAFYEVNSDLTADMSSLELALREVGPGAVVVLIHYFGRTDPRLPEIHDLCESSGCLLLEDLAHAYFSHTNGAPAGRYGTASIFSLHKMLPVSGGGMLKVRRQVGIPSTHPEYASELTRYDNAGIADRRRANYDLTTAALGRLIARGVPVRPLWPAIGAHDVPQTLPILLAPEVRDQFYAWMNGEGVGVVSLYHQLIPELPEGFDRARGISRSITNLPLHQDMGESEVLRVVEKITEFFSGVVT